MIGGSGAGKEEAVGKYFIIITVTNYLRLK